MLCVDTSFLFSLYRQDVHSAAAVSFLTKAARPLLLSVLNDYELGNALRLAEHRGLLPTGESSRRLDAFAEDRAAGLWRRSEVALEEVVAEAGRLSRDYTVAAGHRAFDILHVAHARLVRPKVFLTFDAHQVRLAKAVGLTVGP
jgi:predicted nucleic acid-binding protein